MWCASVRRLNRVYRCTPRFPPLESDIKQFHKHTQPAITSTPPSIQTFRLSSRTSSSKPTNMSAMTQSRQQVYISEGFSEPMSAQHNFANTFDLNDPEAAMSAYQRIMHDHTKRQLSTATDSARRRSGASSSPGAQSLESVSTTD